MIIIDRNLNRLDSFTPEKMALNLEERKSTATLTLGPDQPDLGTGAWLLDDQEPGAGIVWRVKTVETQYNTKTRTVQLEHIVNTLRDVVMFGEITAETIAGKGMTNCTADQAARYCIGYQSLWTIGVVEYNISNPYNFNSEDIFGALETITSSLDDAYWDFDLRQLPFRLNIRRLSSDVDSEMRMDRNVQTLRKTIDRSQMYTRFYAIGKDDLHLPGDYISKNEGVYGRVDHVETDSSMDTAEKLSAWAWERLNRHCEPTVTVQITGLELSQATGEQLDHFTLNRKCRIPLPEYGTTIIDKIVKLSWPDKIADKTKVNITLANQLTDIATIINNANKANSKNGKRKAKDDKEDHAWMIDTDDHVGMVAEAVAGPGADKDWSRVSSIIVDGEGIHQKVVRAENDIVVAQTAIDLNEYRIELEAKRATDKEGELQGKITVEADRITNEVTRAVNEERSLRGALEVQADRVGMTVGVTDTRPIRYIYQTQYLPRPGDESVIYYCQDSKKYYEWKNSTNSYHLTEPGKYIKAGEICVAINESGETEAVIEADKIHLLGQTIANTISANYISAKLASLSQVTINGLNVIGDAYVRNGAGSQQNVSAAIWDIQLTGPVNGVYTLKRRRINEADYTDIGTFSRATSLSGDWSGGELTVTASPQGDTFKADLFTGGHWGYASGEDKKTYYGSISAKHNGGSTSYSTGEYFEVDASSIYEDGRSKGHSEKYVSEYRVTGTGNPYWESGKVYTNASIAADYSTGGTYLATVAIDTHKAYSLGLDDGWYAYYDSSKWEAPSSSNGWKAKIPTKEDSSKNETWLDLTSYSQWHPNSFSMYCTEGGQVPGTQIFRYKFTVESSSNWGYVSGKSYPFYY